MTIYAQDGYGRTNKIEHGIQDGSVAGVIWSPRDLNYRALPRTIVQLRTLYPQIVMLIDPQFYALTYAAALINHRLRHLTKYPYYDSGLSNTLLGDSSIVKRFVRSTLDHQAELPIDRLVSPTVLVEDLGDDSSEIALEMAKEAVSYQASLISAPPLLISLVISETALNSQNAVDQYLDALSLLEVNGFYLIIRRSNQQYSPAFKPTRLVNLLYLVYVLAEINRFEVICGFSDFVGVLLQAVGAKATASGWFSNLRQFTMNRFLPKTGGHNARPRYSSLPLLNSILFNELDSIQRVGQLPAVLSGSMYDGVLTANRSPSEVPWPLDVSYLHHWAVLQQATSPLQGESLKQRLDRCSVMLESAKNTYGSLFQIGVSFETASGSRHVRQWAEALVNFRVRVDS